MTLQQLKDEARKRIIEVEKNFPMSIENWSMEDWLKYTDSLITKAYEEGKREMKKDIMQIELAPDGKTLETVDGCSGRFEAFGYGQGWIMKRIEEI